MTAPTTALPTVADFLGDATGRLDTATRLLAPRRWEDTDPVAVARELSRVLAAVVGAVRVLAGRDDALTSPGAAAAPQPHPAAATTTPQLACEHHHQPAPTSTTDPTGEPR